MGKIKPYINAILLIVAIVLVFSLYAFGAVRHKNREIKDVTITFTDYSSPLISEENVNKLLIQNQDSIDYLTIEKLALQESEKRLDKNSMIRKAEVSMSIDGEINAVIEQRVPIARIIGKKSGYLDEDNKWMPLSDEYAVRVPVIFGYESEFQNDVFELVSFIRKDKWLQKVIAAIELDKGNVKLKPRAMNHKINLGKIDKLEHKFINYKAFIAKAEKDKTLESIDTVDLRFNNQVVVIK
ncbi:hypothetical protein AAT17_04860 [Nonlabens sp. MIC269]|uniref:cell division protein FtsQ/DivIB n=1 Tax=Nonlabens sp. MIC269 TaxID=1476901 RepID=UPI0007227898|nr:hypothetical protein [Nonlabens sp. MIC269]ALM20613.1 hypothetical protein AAT17_04860 [Nonlabens sp. MIC269]